MKYVPKKSYMQVFKNNCSYNSYGIVLADISNSNINDNFCFDNHKGIYTISSECINILRNNCTKSTRYGIELRE
ncbi:MAG: hypothetical protein HGN29_09795 [Asgard group archaeon]|nr:hypothetical protein [Asgard group archaeon]